MAEHSDGPWTAVRSSHGAIDIFDVHDHDIVTLYGDSDLQWANAKLMAAGPRLVYALRVVLRHGIDPITGSLCRTVLKEAIGDAEPVKSSEEFVPPPEQK